VIVPETVIGVARLKKWAALGVEFRRKLIAPVLKFTAPFPELASCWYQGEEQIQGQVLKYYFCSFRYCQHDWLCGHEPQQILLFLSKYNHTGNGQCNMRSAGNLKGYRICHIEPDSLPVYRKTTDDLYLKRIGSNAE
jgi:hypothetical protein